MTGFPKQLKVKGEMTIQCIGLKWKNQGYFADEGELRNMASGVRSIYNKISKGDLKLTMKCAVFQTELNNYRKYLGRAEKEAMKKHSGADYYLIVNSITDGSHAGGKVAHLKSPLIRTACHELGHLIGLAHSGSYQRGNHYDDYGDGSSFMSKFSSATITCPQLYWMGWIDKSQCDLYLGDGKKTFSIKTLGRTETDKVCVIFPRQGDRDAFISYVDGKIMLHLAKQGGSATVKSSKDRMYDDRFTELEIIKLGEKDGFVNISVEFRGEDVTRAIDSCELDNDEKDIEIE